MYKVLMRQTAHDSLREIVSYVSTDNPTAAEKLGSELLDQALSLESLPFRGSQVRKRPGYLKLVHGNAWWKDVVVWQVHSRSFHDSNGSGIGDLNGI